MDTLSIMHKDYLLTPFWKNDISANEALAMIPISEGWATSTWVIIGILALFVAYCFSVSFMVHSNKKNILKSIFETQIRTPYSYLFLFLLSILCEGFLIFRVAMFLGYNFSPKAILFFAIICLLFALVSDILILTIGVIFSQLNRCIIFIKKHFVYTACGAVILFPLCIFIIYASPIIGSVCIWIAFIVGALLVILLNFKLFQLFFESKVALFYLFLYLCTWKFLPIVMLLKAFCESSLIVEF